MTLCIQQCALTVGHFQCKLFVELQTELLSLLAALTIECSMGLNKASRSPLSYKCNVERYITKFCVTRLRASEYASLIYRQRSGNAVRLHNRSI